MSDIDKYKVNGYKPVKNRVPLHMQKPMRIEEEAGWTKYVMQNTDGRREQFEAAGWIADTNKKSNLSDDHIQNGNHFGSEVVLTTNRRPGATSNTATVMRIPTEIYNQDLRARQVMNNNKVGVLNPENNKGLNGSSYGHMKREEITSTDQLRERN